MHVSGNQLRIAIKSYDVTVDDLSNEFDNSLYGFKDEQKRNPNVIYEELTAIEQKQVFLEVLLQKFNINTMVKLTNGEEHSLSALVKLQGTVSRSVKRWRHIVNGKIEKRRYDYSDNRVRRNDEERATSLINMNDARALLKQGIALSNDIARAIAAGNAQLMDFPELTPDYLVV